jgi:DNA-binding NarL/FixJ family response regulator
MKTKKNGAGRKAAPARKRVLIIDDHIVVRQGIRYLINCENDLEVCGEASDARKGMDAINQLKPDIVLVDISLPGTNGIEFIKNARACRPDLPVVVLSMHDESLYGERALRAGAMGYVMKSSSSEEIITALRKALRGELHLGDKINGALLQRFLGKQARENGSPVSILSDRELEVFELIGHGKSTREIAALLHLGIKTVDSHRTHIKEKLSIQSSTELIQRAVQHVDSEALRAPPG